MRGIAAYDELFAALTEAPRLQQRLLRAWTSPGMNTPTIPEEFLRAARQYPDKPAFHVFRAGWHSLSYGDFAAGVLSTAAHLIGSGLKTGDRVGIFSENRPEWCSAYLSIVTAGLVAVPIDAQLGAEEVDNLLGDAEATVVFHSDRTLQNLAVFADKMRAAGQEVRFFSFDSPAYEAITRSGAAATFPDVAPGDLASIIYTSGTTGKPKGVMLTHANFCSDARALIEAKIVSHEDNVLSVLPLHHTYAFMCTFLVPLFLGASVTYPESIKGADIVAAIQEKSVTILIGVPRLLELMRDGMLRKITAAPPVIAWGLLRLHRLAGFLRTRTGLNLGRLIFKPAHEAMGKQFRFHASGGAKLDPTVMKDLEALGFTVLEGYGLTETSPVVTFNPISKRKPGSAGRPLPSVEIRILDPSTTGEGEVALKGPMVMEGYYKNPAATAEVLQNGWFRTGDIGRIDDEGYLYITGRAKEVIVLSSGKNIYPDEIEKAYASSPLIKEICVTGVEKGGVVKSLHGIIVPDYDHARAAGIANVQEAVKWEVSAVSSKLPPPMRIAGYSLRKDPLPRTPLGKLRRFMIKPADAGPRSPEADTARRPPPDEVSQLVIDIVRTSAGIERQIGRDDDLELDIGLDSLSKIELAVALEKAFGEKLPENFMTDLRSVGDLIDGIKLHTGGAAVRDDRKKSGWKKILAEEPPEAIPLPQTPAPAPLLVRILFPALQLLFRLLFRLEARGIGRIPADRNFIIAPNHTSYLDGPAVILSLPFSFFERIYALGLQEFFTGALRSRFARLAHVIPIDSSAYLNKSLQMAAHVLRNNRSLTVFPEGGRSFGGELMEFKKGIGILAVEMGVPVIPTLIEGAFEALPREASIPRPRKITITYGEPLSAAGIDLTAMPPGMDEYQYFVNLVRDRIISMKTEGAAP